MIYDKNFLKQLDLERNKIKYGRITLLNRNEEPIGLIEGSCSSGSLNIDGTSAVRRTCSLSLVSNDVDFADYLWTFTSKIKIEIGLQNNINTLYPNIIWFSQGIFVLTSFNSSLSTNSYTINLQGKDKMCYLNGENGGAFQSAVDFGKYEQVDEEGNVEYVDQLIKDIIMEMVHTYGGEPFHNIIINDLDEMGLIAQEWRYKEPLYLERQGGIIGEYQTATVDGTKKVWWNNGTQPIEISLDHLPTYDSLLADTTIGTAYYLTEEDAKQQRNPWHAIKFNYGDLVGYKETELTFPGDLIGNPGETVTSILDKIIQNFSDFEYFYNLDGQFVFQKKKNYLNTHFAPDVIYSEDNELYGIEPYVIATDSIYDFENNELITNFNNTPNISNIKNDYSIWGKRGSSNAIPIHLRYAIDKKPISYTTISVSDDDLIDYNKKYNFQTSGQNSVTYRASSGQSMANLSTIFISNVIENIYDDKPEVITLMTDAYNYKDEKLTIMGDTNIPIVYCDWREIIYRMALDFRKYNHLNDFSLRVAQANPEQYPNGQTGYEQYYIDLEGFWRQLYNPEQTYNPASVLTQGQTYYKQVKNYTLATSEEWHINGEKRYYLASESGEIPVYAPARWGNYNNTTTWLTAKGEPAYQVYKLSDSFQLAQLDDSIAHIESMDQNLYNIYKISFKDAQLIDKQIYTITKVTSNTQSHSWPIYQKIEKIIGNTVLYQLIPSYSFDDSLELYDIVLATAEQLDSESVELYVREPYYGYKSDIPFGYTTDIYTIKTTRPQYINETYYIKHTDGNYYHYLGKIGPEETSTVFTFEKTNYFTKSDEYYANNHFKFAHWNKNIVNAPELLNFWFDLLDTTSALSQYNVSTVGVRPKIINDDKIKAIYQKTIPLCIFSDMKNAQTKSGYIYIPYDSIVINDLYYEVYLNSLGILTAKGDVSVGDLGKSTRDLIDPVDGKKYRYWRYETYNYNNKTVQGWRGQKNHPGEILFSNGSQSKTAQEELENVLYNNTYTLEAVSISAVPVYYLEPNRRIHLFKPDMNIEGDYLLSKISVPLTYNGTMNLTATKIYERNL